jgi:hypothetical protein
MTTIITDPAGARVQAIFLKGHCRLLAAGLQPPRGVRKSDILRKAGAITGKTYKRGQYDVAATDLAKFLEESA